MAHPDLNDQADRGQAELADPVEEHAPPPAHEPFNLRRPIVWMALIAFVLALMVLQDLVRNAFA